jgi:hypothetical protein
MWIHVFEASLTGVALLVIPLMLIAALVGALALIARLFDFLERHHIRASA